VDQYDFFLLGCDDMMYVVENLRAYLGSEEIIRSRAERSGESWNNYDENDVDDVDDESFSTIQDYSSDESFNHLGKPSLIAEVRMSPSISAVLMWTIVCISGRIGAGYILDNKAVKVRR